MICLNWYDKQAKLMARKGDASYTSSHPKGIASLCRNTILTANFSHPSQRSTSLRCRARTRLIVTPSQLPAFLGAVRTSNQKKTAQLHLSSSVKPSASWPTEESFSIAKSTQKPIMRTAIEYKHEDLVQTSVHLDEKLQKMKICNAPRACRNLLADLKLIL
jgi:hypothetical protein